MKNPQVDQIQSLQKLGKTPRILVCGIGSKHFLDDYLELLNKHYLAPIVIAGTELESRIEYASKQLYKAGIQNIKVIPIKPFGDDNKICKEDENKLNNLVEQEDINGVIIITEAIAHLPYLKWAVQKGIPCLVEKPLTSYNGIAQDFNKAQQILTDYDYLKKAIKDSGSFVSIVSQRRWNKAFLFIKDKIEEVYTQYGIPVSLLRGMKNKGDWMKPSHLLTKENHPYKYGYGVLSHTGYHPVDIMDFTVSKISKDLGINRIEVFAQMSYPKDVYLGTKHARIFSDDINDLNVCGLGECSVNGVYSYFKDDTKVLLANLQISNNGLCQKDFSHPEGHIWDRTTGTIRQEAYTWTQGPFQEIDFEIYQDKTNTHKSLYEYGGDNYGLITIKRNGKVKNVEKISIEDFEVDNERAAEACLKEAILEFIERISGNKITPRSDLEQHEIPIKIESGLYQSAIKNLPISIDIGEGTNNGKKS